ncbi:hypothetical protein BJF83_08805 [Nocardiopsis sp. CNR-923]|uniref:hypothetical protein n=1 Tax=Nocardiopsis sp. CNR-923 TaxID=1904965 RepID=UPI000959E279|nr:hypothetical protein [Nocardiopsis sp. CNR-923]OLT30378.1 hypothetical protein BJF83_08805 [Nocardiopsis sp. CNR-923]
MSDLDADHEPKVSRAPHANGPKYDPLVDKCQDGVGDGGIHHLSYFDHGLLSFSVTSALFGLGLAADQDDVRSQVDRMGRRLAFVHTRVDYSLASVRSGRLIRMVLLLPPVAVLYYLVRPGEYLVAAVVGTGPEEVDAADRNTAALVGRLRSIMGLGSQNPGGFSTMLPSWKEHEGSDPPLVTQGSTEGRGTEHEACTFAVAADDLHYVACFEDSRFTFSVDLLDHPALAVFFRDITVDERRSRYQDIGNLLHRVVRMINGSALAQWGGPLGEMVVDVEEGAVYYFGLCDGSYLVGVTLDQNRVDTTEQVLRQLASTLRQIRGVDGAADHAQ